MLSKDIVFETMRVVLIGVLLVEAPKIPHIWIGKQDVQRSEQRPFLQGHRPFSIGY